MRSRAATACASVARASSMSAVTASEGLLGVTLGPSPFPVDDDDDDRMEEAEVPRRAPASVSGSSVMHTEEAAASAWGRGLVLGSAAPTRMKVAQGPLWHITQGAAVVGRW